MNSPARDAFAARLRQALDEAGYSGAQLKELAQIFEVTPQAVRKWLGGESLPSSTRIAEVASILGVRRSWLLDGELPARRTTTAVEETGKVYSKQEESIFSISGTEYRLLQNYRELPRHLKDAIETIINEVTESVKSQKPS
ncbi:MAG: helix-turn-helix domain-containing protein [Pseudomonadales bacterium]|nr:helix-turn-helix domain-containing protein [Pseudomonadales bacterium]